MKSKKNIIADLGKGLIMRRATKKDIDTLAKFNGEVHGTENYAEMVDITTREMMSGTNPHIKARDFTLVEDTKKGKIASSLNLISQTWTYEDVEFGVGRVEIVGTDKEYRRKNLVRKQIDEVHRWSRNKGHLMQGITGIPWFYSKFGYDMLVNLGGGKYMPIYMVPELKKDKKENIKIRKARKSDILFLQKLYEKGCERSLISCVRSKEMWEHDLTGRLPGGLGTSVIKVIEDLEGKRIGYLMHASNLWGTSLALFALEFDTGVSWLDTTPGVLRHLKETALEYLKEDNEKNKKKAEEEKKEFKPKELHGLAIRCGEEHPLHDLFPTYFPATNKPYAWFIRIENLPAFLRRIKPVLERRIANSTITEYSGEVKLNFYTSGLIIKFKDGRFVSVRDWAEPDPDKAHGSFPDQTFLHILLGYRSLDEITDSRADCYANYNVPEAKIVLNTLFPKKVSNIWPIE